MSHPALTADSVALVTGGASGIGLAAAERFGQIGMSVILVDRAQDRIARAADRVKRAGSPEVMTAIVDVSDRSQWDGLAADVSDRFGGVDILMNNAGVGGKSSCIGSFDAWETMLGVNLLGAVHGVQTFAPGMIARGRAGAIINTGSKQGITTPPGNPAYNVSKAGLKTFTEALAHELRNIEACRVTAHLLIPGFVYTGMIRAPEKPASAWTPEQTVDFCVDRLAQGDFYILCPDNDVPRDLDEKRIAWAIGDLIENRPALSRWHPDYREAFATFVGAPPKG